NGYMNGGSWLNHILHATVVCFAYPLYNNREKITDNVSIIFASVLTGVMLNFMLVFLTLKAFGYSKDVIVTLLTSSITAAVGIEVSHELGGTDTMTVLFLITTGLIGSILSSMIFRFGRFESSIAKG
ncbi:LrgB family protein, partial [Staphylococcus aureus]|uniref:LrgB family protein n=1 Tax=Staphylococcus aureus TaxID=1280 RepID=UPI00210A083D